MMTREQDRPAGQGGNENLEIWVEHGRKLHSRAVFEALAKLAAYLGNVFGSRGKSSPAEAGATSVGRV